MDWCVEALRARRVYIRSWRKIRKCELQDRGVAFSRGENQGTTAVYFVRPGGNQGSLARDTATARAAATGDEAVSLRARLAHAATLKEEHLGR